MVVIKRWQKLALLFLLFQVICVFVIFKLSDCHGLHPHIEASLKLSDGTELDPELYLLQFENRLFY